MPNDAILRHLAYVDFSKPGSVVRGIYLQKGTGETFTTFKPDGWPLAERQVLDHLHREGILVGREHSSIFSKNSCFVNFDFEWNRYREMGFVHQLCKGGPLPILFEECFEDGTGVITKGDFQLAYPDPISTIEPVIGYKPYWFCLETDHGRPRYIGMREPHAGVWVELMESVRTGFHTLPGARQMAEHQVWQVREAKAWKVGVHWEHYLDAGETLPCNLTYHDACLAAAEIEIARQRFRR